MKFRNKVNTVLGGSLAAAGLLMAPSAALADPTGPHFEVDDNSPALTATVEHPDATITVTAPEGTVMCTTPIVVRGALDAESVQAALDEAGADPGTTPAVPGLPSDDLSTIVYPTVIDTDPVTFDPPIGTVTNFGPAANSPYTVELTNLADGAHSALVSCVDPAQPGEIDVLIRNFQIGENVPAPETGSTGSLQTGSLGSLFGSS